MLPPGCTGTGSRACVAHGPVWPGPASGWLADHSTGGPGAGTWPDLSLLPGNEAPLVGTGTLWLKMIKYSLLYARPAGETSGNKEDETRSVGLLAEAGRGRSTKRMWREGEEPSQSTQSPAHLPLRRTCHVDCPQSWESPAPPLHPGRGARLPWGWTWVPRSGRPGALWEVVLCRPAPLLPFLQPSRTARTLSPAPEAPGRDQETISL